MEERYIVIKEHVNERKRYLIVDTLTNTKLENNFWYYKEDADKVAKRMNALYRRQKNGTKL